METFVGDTVRLVLRTGIPLAGYTDIAIRYRKPDGTTGEWIGSVATEDDNWLEYTTLETDLDMSGTWVLQARVASTGVVLHGLWADFIVHDPLTIMPLLIFGATMASFAGDLTS